MPSTNASYDQNSFLIKQIKRIFEHNVPVECKTKKNTENILIKIFPVKSMNIGSGEEYCRWKHSYDLFVWTEGNHPNAC